MNADLPTLLDLLLHMETGIEIETLEDAAAIILAVKQLEQVTGDFRKKLTMRRQQCSMEDQAALSQLLQANHTFSDNRMKTKRYSSGITADYRVK